MAVQLINGAVFLHIPKTGGSWVTQVLKESGLVEREIGHIHADMVRVRFYSSGKQAFIASIYQAAKSRLPRSLKASIMTPSRRRQLAEREHKKTPFTFCFVRHPLRWYESWWRYMNGRSGSDWASESDLLSWHPCSAIKNCGDDSYEQYIRNVMESRPGFVSELFSQYAQPEIGFVGKQENLTDNLITVLNQLDLKFDEQRIRDRAAENVSHHDDSVALSAELQRELERLEYSAIRRYGYSDSSVAT